MKQIAIDASEGGAKADFGAIIFGGLLNGVVYIDAKVARMPIPLLLDEAFEMGLQYRPEEVCFEGDQFQKLLVGAFQVAGQQAVRDAVEHRLHPDGRHRQGDPHPAAGVLVPRSASSASAVARQASNCLEQTRTFGLPKVHDDGPDALEMLLRRMNERAFELYEENGGDAELADRGPCRGLTRPSQERRPWTSLKTTMPRREPGHYPGRG